MPATKFIIRNHRRLFSTSSNFSSSSFQSPKFITNLIESCDSMAKLKQIHGHFTCKGLMAQNFPASRVLAFCALSDAGDVAYAALVFDHFTRSNTYMWNTMIRGYKRSKSPSLGFDLFRKMIAKRIEVDGRTFVFVLKCIDQFAEGLVVGESVHCVVCKLGFECDLLAGNGLMHFYVEMGELVSARKVFDEMPEWDVVSWTTVIDGYSKGGWPCEALRLFSWMVWEGFEPNEVTMITVISAVARLGDLRLGRLVHSYVERSGMNSSLNLYNALVDMYGKCGFVEYAEKIFARMLHKDVFSWTSMMTAYAKCDNLESAKQIFDNMPIRNSVTWTGMIEAYSQANRSIEAINLFHEMIACDVKPIATTLISVLTACSQLGSLDLGKWIYHHYIHSNVICLHIKLANAFIDMYAKCGDLMAAAKLFNEMREKNIVTWNTMILSYAVHGYSNEALALFEHMKEMKLVPDAITFVGVLSACCHGGFVVEGKKYFEEMKPKFGIKPKGIHYACLIDLLGRAGLMEKAYEVVKSMTEDLDEAGWGALLNACKMHGNIEIGKHIGKKLLCLNPEDSGVYVLISNLYASRNKWDDVKKIRMMMRDKGVKKTPGCSSIEVAGKLHDFFASDLSHIKSEDIYMVLDTIYSHLELKGYFPKR